MPEHKTYRRKVFLYFIAVFLVFTVAVLLFQLNREKRYKKEELENTLDNVTGITDNYIQHYHLLENDNFHKVDTLKYLLHQPNIRITVIDKTGKVLYDSFVKDYKNMENHLQRPEVQKALYSNIGANIRFSNTTKQDFYYYAKNFDNYFVRVAMVYNIQVENFLKGERYFIFFTVVYVSDYLVAGECNNQTVIGFHHKTERFCGESREK